MIYEKTGVQLTVGEDRRVTETEHEILIGKTNRTASAVTLGSDDYVINVTDSKMVICGGEFGTTWHALDYLEELFGKALENRESDFNFKSDYSYKGNYHLTRIGCIGDSITEGVGSSDSRYFAYPAQLARYLWKDALVFNYGSSGATMSSDMNDAYTKRGVYTNALRDAANIDIFTIMLGTNDSNRERNWTTAWTNSFNNSCLNIADSLKQKNPDVRFVLANCPAYFGSDGFGSATIRNIQKRLVATMNDSGYPTTFFEMYKVTMSMSEYYPDKLHPNDTGHMLMAEAFAKALEEVIHGINNAE